MKKIKKCKDCGMLYEHFGMDSHLPRAQWLEINNGEDGGLLCIQCIFNRASNIPGASVVHCIIEIAPHKNTTT